MDSPIFCFGPFRLVARERVLLKDGVPVSLGSRAFDLLLALVEHAGETVDREELFKRVWPHVVVSKVNLRVHIAGLRKVLADGQDGNRFIVSVAGRGYCFVAAVNRFQSAVLPAAELSGYSQVPERTLRSSQPLRKGRMSVAFAIAYTLVTNFDDALCFVDLTDIDDPAQVAGAVASALGCAVTPQHALGCVLAYLQDREMLLVLDNCDHVLTGVEQLTKRLFTEAPQVHILVSSRWALRLSHLPHAPQQGAHCAKSAR